MRLSADYTSEVLGPFCRVSNDTPEALLNVARTGELWGSPPDGSPIPSVQGYFGRLEEHPYFKGNIGLEFWTWAKPHSWQTWDARWILGSDGVMERAETGQARIEVLVTRLLIP